MKRILIAATCLACLAAAGATAARSKTDVMITSTTRTDAPAKPGQASSEAAAIARATELFLAEALDRARPCTVSLTPTDIRTLLEHERNRELLGSGDDAALAAIAGAMGTDSLVSVNVVQLAGNVTISVSMISTRNARTLQRASTTMPIDGSTVDKLEAFAESFAKTMTGEMRACPPVPDRYQQQDKAQRAEQKERTARAEARVASYAQTIK